MNILIANDDGYKSQGLRILAEKLAEENNVYVVGPSSNRSAVSHHISMFNDTEIHKIEDRIWSCEGFPADCVAIGLISNLFGVKFDCVVSGINFGPNIGTDITYSGTCAAARQAVYSGIPGIALSIDPVDWEETNKQGWKFEKMAEFAAKNLKTLMSMCSVNEPRAFVNVNGASLSEYKGVKITDKLCVREYNDILEIKEKDGKTVSVFTPGVAQDKYYDPDTDYSLVRQGYLSVSVVYADPVCKHVVDGIKFKL